MAFNECHNINAPGTYESVDIIVTYAVLYGRRSVIKDVVDDDEADVEGDEVVLVASIEMSELERIMEQLFNIVGGRPAFLQIIINPSSNSNHSFIPFLNSCRRCREPILFRLPMLLLFLLFGRFMILYFSTPNERRCSRQTS